MISLAKGAVGLLALGAAAGAGFGASYLHSEAKPQQLDGSGNPQPTVPEKKRVVLPENWKLLSTEDGKEKEEWQKKVSAHNGSSKKLEGYEPETGENKEDLNIGKMKKVCKKLMEDEFEVAALGDKLSQAKDWCSIKKKVKEMLGKNKAELSFDENDKEKDKAEWEKMFEEKLKDSEKKFVVDGWQSTNDNKEKKDEDIKLMKKKCKKLQVKEVEDGKGSDVTLFETWCTKNVVVSA